MEKKFCYEYPRPAVTTDCVVLCFDENRLKVLLIKRRDEPFKGKWAFPGGFMEMKENSDEAALRELYEETGIKNVFAEQFHTFTGVDRDPRGRTISVSYYALTRLTDVRLNAGDDASEAGWFTISEKTPLAFDHEEILSEALAELKEKFRHYPVCFRLLPLKFTIPALQNLYEVVFDKKFERRNFRKKFISTGLLIDLKEAENGKGHRGAGYYRFDSEKYENMAGGGYEFPDI